MFFLYKIYGKCLSERGNTEMLKQEDLNVMCTFSPYVDHSFVVINGIFRLTLYTVNLIVEGCGPPPPLVNWGRLMTHQVDVEIGMHWFSLGFC